MTTKLSETFAASKTKTKTLSSVEIFRTGSHDRDFEWTEQHLTDIVKDYDPTFQEAPVTVDHDQWGPAFGWVPSISRRGNTLFADLDVTPEFAAQIESGAFKKSSVELYTQHSDTGRPYLKAVTFLGAAAPAVKGMPDVKFKEGAGDHVQIEFSEVEAPVEVIDEEVNKLEPELKGETDMYEEVTLELLKQHRPDLFAEMSDQTSKEFFEMAEKNEKFEEVEAKVVDLEAKLSELTTERDTALAARDTMKTAADEAANKAAMAETKTAIESLLSESELPKPSVERIAKQFADAVNVDGLDEAIADAKAFLEELGTTGVQVSGMGETEDQDDAENTLLASRADAIVAEKGCDYGTALIEAGAK